MQNYIVLKPAETKSEAQFLWKSVKMRRMRDETNGSCVTVVFQPHEGELEHTLCLFFNATSKCMF